MSQCAENGRRHRGRGKEHRCAEGEEEVEVVAAAEEEEEEARKEVGNEGRMEEEVNEEEEMRATAGTYILPDVVRGSLAERIHHVSQTLEQGKGKGMGWVDLGE